jgi:hypothetical protein
MAVKSKIFANSSVIASASWDTATRLLTVTFKSGKVYTTTVPVPEETWDGFDNATSAGQYFNENIKGQFG